MEKQRFLVLSVAEAKEALAKFYADFLTNDPANTLEMIRESKLHDSVPDVMNMADDKVADLYGELCLGEALLIADETIDMVAVKIGDFHYEMVAMRGQLYPKEPK
jgi:hypothetical protein